MPRAYKQPQIKKSKWRSPKHLSEKTICASLDAMKTELSEACYQTQHISRLAFPKDSMDASLNAEIQRLRERKAEIESKRHSQLAAVFNGSFYSEAAKHDLRCIEQEIARKLPSLPPEVFEVNGRNYDLKTARCILQSTIDDLKKNIEAYEGARILIARRKERLKELKVKKDVQKQRIAELRAAAAINNVKARGPAAKLRRKMAKQGCCPYCADGGEKSGEIGRFENRMANHGSAAGMAAAFG